MLATYKKLSDSFALCGNASDANTAATGPLNEAERAKRQREARQEAARSKSGLWGPTHSFDSEEEEKKTDGWFAATPAKADDGASPDDTMSTKSSHSPETPARPSWGGWPGCNIDTTAHHPAPSRPNKQLLDYVDELCSPCNRQSDLNDDDFPSESGLGICRMQPPGFRQHPANSNDNSDHNSMSTQTPADRRMQRYKRRQQRQQGSPVTPHDDYEVTGSDKVVPIPSIEQSSTSKRLPLESLTLDKTTAVELERSISELTMRSSHGQNTAKVADHRRMAYYAVGKHHRQSGRGGNRRCYFTGKLILGGAPFYAGSVQQGLRTLVVFCLPSSLGLPKEVASRGDGSVLQSLEGGSKVLPTQPTGRRRGSWNEESGSFKGNRNQPTTQSILSRKGSRISKMSSMDEMSLSVGEELDPNWGLDKDYLLNVLPEPKQSLLDEMARRYPQQFETLPVQVRSPVCWRLYVKFCFFSGLPIAEGELHYKVRDDVADLYGEEVILSHEVMEAVNGTSAEILRLPNIKTFRYLRKHYHQQSTKLPDQVFQRKSWEMVRAEV